MLIRQHSTGVWAGQHSEIVPLVFWMGDNPSLFGGCVLHEDWLQQKIQKHTKLHISHILWHKISTNFPGAMTRTRRPSPRLTPRRSSAPRLTRVFDPPASSKNVSPTRSYPPTPLADRPMDEKHRSVYRTLCTASSSNNNNNNNSSFISTADNPQLIFYNKLPRRTAQIQSNTKNQL